MGTARVGRVPHHLPPQSPSSSVVFARRKNQLNFMQMSVGCEGGTEQRSELGEWGKIQVKDGRGLCLVCVSLTCFFCQACHSIWVKTYDLLKLELYFGLGLDQADRRPRQGSGRQQKYFMYTHALLPPLFPLPSCSVLTAKQAISRV